MNKKVKRLLDLLKLCFEVCAESKELKYLAIHIAEELEEIAEM